MGDSSKAIGIVVPSHFTDEAINLRAVNRKQVDFLLNLDLLFFSHVAVPLVGILDNPYFTSMILHRSEMASQLLRGKDSFIQPIIFSYSDENEPKDVRDIAQRVIDKKTKRYVSKDNFIQNAEFMDEDKPMTYSASDSFFRRQYRDDLLRAVTFIHENGLCGWKSQEVILPSGSLAQLQRWLHRIDPEQTSCTGAFDVIEKDLHDEAQQTEAKIVAASTWMYSLRGSMITNLSVPPSYLPSISLLRRLSPTTLVDVAREDVEATKLPISVPFSEIASMPLRFILEVRKLSAFREIRKLLFKYRKSGRSISIERLTGKIDQCREQLLSYEREARYHLDKGEQNAWDSVLSKLRDRAQIDRLKIWHSITKDFTVGLSISSIKFPQHIPLTAIACGGARLLGRYIAKREAAMSTSLAEAAKEDTMYSVAWGTHRKKTEQK